MTQSRLRVVVGSACLLAFTATGCSSSDGGSSGAGATTAASAATDSGGAAALTIDNEAFGSASVVAGTEFTIANDDGRPHTVTDDDGGFDVSVSPGGTATLTIPDPGTYKIHCRIHSGMHGTITVS